MAQRRSTPPKEQLEVPMPFPQTIFVNLTEIQLLTVQRLRKTLPYFSDDEFEKYIVALGLVALIENEPGDPNTWQSKDHSTAAPSRTLGDHITFRIPDDLRPRLENLLSMAPPELGDDEALASLIELGIDTLIELGLIRERDVALPAAKIAAN
jgi:hypothetical protein